MVADGVIGVLTAEKPDGFTPDDVRLLELVADWLAQAVDRARLLVAERDALRADAIGETAVHEMRRRSGVAPTSIGERSTLPSPHHSTIRRAARSAAGPTASGSAPREERVDASVSSRRRRDVRRMPRGAK